MQAATDAIESMLSSIKTALGRISKLKGRGVRQIRGGEDLSMLDAISQAWFHTHRQAILTYDRSVDVENINTCFAKVLDATDRFAAVSTYESSLKSARDSLKAVRKHLLTTVPVTDKTDDLAPDFSPLAGNQQMREILTRRWNECALCVSSGAHLASIVMMGGLLEAIFVARANKLEDKGPLMESSHVPIDGKTNKKIPYQNWMLDSYIKVGHDLGWITAASKDVADRIKEYRNYVHPAKELRMGVVLGGNDSSILWQVTKALVRQLLVSA